MKRAARLPRSSRSGRSYRNRLADTLPTLIGGSADLGPSTNCHCRIAPDGLCRVTPGFLAEFEAFRKRTGTRVFAVLVDVGSSAEVSARQ